MIISLVKNFSIQLRKTEEENQLDQSMIVEREVLMRRLSIKNLLTQEEFWKKNRSFRTEALKERESQVRHKTESRKIEILIKWLAGYHMQSRAIRLRMPSMEVTQICLKT